MKYEYFSHLLYRFALALYTLKNENTWSAWTRGPFTSHKVSSAMSIRILQYKLQNCTYWTDCLKIMIHHYNHFYMELPSKSTYLFLGVSFRRLQWMLSWQKSCLKSQGFRKSLPRCIEGITVLCSLCFQYASNMGGPCQVHDFLARGIPCIITYGVYWQYYPCFLVWGMSLTWHKLASNSLSYIFPFFLASYFKCKKAFKERHLNCKWLSKHDHLSP